MMSLRLDYFIADLLGAGDSDKVDAAPLGEDHILFVE